MALSPAPGEVSGFVWRFGNTRYDDRRRELTVHGAVMDIESKPLDVLQYLLRHAGEAVTKDELLAAVWPGITVVDGSLATAISKLRKALGDDAGVIVTLPRVGYRLAADVHCAGEASAARGSVMLASGGEVPRRPGWRLVRPMGRSADNEVWLGEHAKTREQRVFKFALRAERRTELEREVTVSRLLRQALGDRDDFVRVLEWHFDELPYTVESACGGISLVEWCDEHGGLAAVALDRRLALMAAVSRAVGAAHGAGVLHRDLKPSNILVSSGQDGRPHVRVADFGGAALLRPERLTALGITNLGFQQTGDVSIFGSMTYVAPELLLGHQPTPASDVYALGVMLYQLVVGDFRKPLAPGWETDVPDPVLREDIAVAAAGDPARRLPDAAALAERLRTLPARQAESARPADETPAAETPPASTRRWSWTALLAAALVVAAAAGVFLQRRFVPPSRSTAVASQSAIASLAVLPLANLSNDASQDYLADGITEALIADFSGIRALRVISRTTMMAYRQSGKPLTQVAEELGVDGIVEGSLSRLGDRVRLTAQLVQAASGRTLWTRSYDGDAGDLFELQRTLARQLAREIRVTIQPTETRQLEAERRVDARAYDLYLRGRFFWNRRTRADLLRAVDYFRQATAIDPQYALAHAGVADAYVELVGFGNLAPSDGLPEAKAAAARAIAIEPSLAEGHAALAYAHAADWSWQAADAEFREALALNPGYVVTLYQYGFFLSLMGRHDEAIDLVERALASDPLSPVVRYRAGRVYYQARRFDKAHEQFAKILELNPADPLGLYGHGLVYAAEGDFAHAIAYLDKQPLQRGFDAAAALASAGSAAEARRRLADGIRRHEAAHDYLRPGWVAEVYASLGDHAAAIAWLQRGYAERDAWLALIKVWPPFDTLRGDPAFRTLLAQMRFPD